MLAWSGISRLTRRRRILLLAFQPRDPVFVGLSDLEEGSAGVPQCADLPGMLTNLPGVLENRSALLDNLSGLFLTLAQKEFDGLRQGFMPLRQPV
jgi:hypothetical protein